MSPEAVPALAELSTDVLIVGGGPIGIAMAVALRKAGIDFEVCEAGVLGQTISWWAPQTRWFSSNERISIAGVPLLTTDQAKATREQYLTYLRGVAEQFDIRVRCQQRVVGATSARPGYRVATIRGGVPQTIHCRRIVLATGGTDRPRRLGIPGEELPHVDGYLREPHLYWGRRVLIVGGRNSAVEAALRLHHAGANVSLSYRQAGLPEDGIKYWLMPEIRSLLKHGRIGSYLGTVPTEITPTHVVLRGCLGEDHHTERVEVDAVLTLIGYEQDKQLFQAMGIELVGETRRPAVNGATMETNLVGVYVAGTAVAGTQTSHYKTFLENCHVHIEKILADLQGGGPVKIRADFEQEIAAQPES